MSSPLQVEIVSIEGNIGSGKSTLLAALKTFYADRTDVVFLKEPVDEWETITDEAGQGILAKFYADQHRYAFSFQIMAYISRLEVLRNAVEDCHRRGITGRVLFISERSLFTDKMVFAKMLYDSGRMEHVNHQIYLKWFDLFARDYPVGKVIYVNTRPDICHERIHRRSRQGEQGIPLDYLQQCDQYHQQMLDTTLASCVCQNQLTLNGNADMRDSHGGQGLLQEWLASIDQFLGTNHVQP